MLYMLLLHISHFQPHHLDQCDFPVGRTICVYLLDFRMGFDAVFQRPV